MKTIVKLVACSPLKSRDIEVTVSRGLPDIKQKRELTELRVVFPSESGYEPGDTVWCKGDIIKHDYTAIVYDHGGVQFILIPADMIVAHSKKG